MKYPCLLLLVSILVMSGCATAPTSKTPANDHEAIVKAAGEKVQRWEFNEALTDLNRVIAEDPKNEGAYSWRAGLYVRKRDYEKALADYDAALALKPTAANYLNRAQLKSDKKDLDGALQDIEAALKLNAHEILAYSLRGGIRAKQKNYAEAIADYDHALLLQDESPKFQYIQRDLLYTDRGEAKESSGDYPGAIADYTKAIEFQGAYSHLVGGSPYYRRGRVKYRKHEYADAILDFSRSVSSEPEKANAYYYRGICKHRQNDPKGAISDFDNSLKLKPDALTFRGRGMAKRSLGHLKEALNDLDEAIKLSPQSALTWCYRGRVKLALDDPRGALDDYAASLKEDPELTFVYFDVGVAHQVAGDYPAALKSYEKALSQPEDSAVYLRILRGLLLERTGVSNVSAELAPFVDSWSAEWEKNLGMYLTTKISEEELLRRAVLGKAESIQAQQCEAFYYIGISHLLAGDETKAKAAFEKCVEVRGATVSERLLAHAELKNL